MKEIIIYFINGEKLTLPNMTIDQIDIYEKAVTRINYNSKTYVIYMDKVAYIKEDK